MSESVQTPKLGDSPRKQRRPQLSPLLTSLQQQDALASARAAAGAASNLGWYTGNRTNTTSRSARTPYTPISPRTVRTPHYSQSPRTARTPGTSRTPRTPGDRFRYSFQSLFSERQSSSRESSNRQPTHRSRSTGERQRSADSESSRRHARQRSSSHRNTESRSASSSRRSSSRVSQACDDPFLLSPAAVRGLYNLPSRTESHRGRRQSADWQQSYRSDWSHRSSVSSIRSVRNAVSDVVSSTKNAIDKAKEWRERRKNLEEERRREKVKATIGSPTQIEGIDNPTHYQLKPDPLPPQDPHRGVASSVLVPKPLRLKNMVPIYNPWGEHGGSRITLIDDFMQPAPPSPSVYSRAAWVPDSIAPSTLPGIGEDAAEQERFNALRMAEEYQMLAGVPASSSIGDPVSPLSEESVLPPLQPVSPFTAEHVAPPNIYKSAFAEHLSDGEDDYYADSDYVSPRSQWRPKKCEGRAL